MKIINSHLNRMSDKVWALRLDKNALASYSPTGHKYFEQLASLDDGSSCEFRIQASNYKIAALVASVVQQLGLIHIEAFSKPIQISIQNNGKELDGDYVINCTSQPFSYYTQYWKNLTTEVLSEKNVLYIDVARNTSSIWNQIFIKAQRIHLTDIQQQYINQTYVFELPSTKLNEKASFCDQLSMLPFSDPFTEIAREGIQKWESDFEMSDFLRGDYRLVLENDVLALKKMYSNGGTRFERGENSRTVSAYRNFLIKEYGQEIISYIESQYGINLSQMINLGMPLHSSHIYRFNVGVNKIEIQMLDNLYEKIVKLQKDCDKVSSDQTVEILWDLETLGQTPQNFSLREIKGLLRLVCPLENMKAPPTVGELKNFLEVFKTAQSCKSAQELSKKQFAILASILFCPEAYLKQVYTGKQDQQKLNDGFSLFHQTQPFEPTHDLQNLLESFAACKNAKSWQDYYEVLSQTISRLHLIYNHPKQGWQLGAIIPGPNDENGVSQYYKLDSCYDDGQEIFNYTFVKACHDYSNMPLIKVYRNSQSDPYALKDWWFKRKPAEPQTSFSMETLKEAYTFEKSALEDRTIPLWVAYLIKANELYQKMLNTEEESLEKQAIYHQIAIDYKKAYELLIEDSDANRFSIEVPHNLSDKSTKELKEVIEALETILNDVAHEEQELPEYKKSEDISFIGHIYSGAAAQKALVHMASIAKRIPLKGQKYICYTSHSPGIDHAYVDQFYDFGKKYGAILDFFKQKWDLLSQFEYGGWIRDLGERHIGGTDLSEEKYSSWLNIRNWIFKPLETATSTQMTAKPTHYRQINGTVEGVDYSLRNIPAQELYQYDCNLVLTSELREHFGRNVSPQVSQTIFRYLDKVWSVASYPLKKMGEQVILFFDPDYENKNHFDSFYISSESDKKTKPSILF